ncbi:threonine dehydratase [Candidatus Peregrinibacteria bacterium CG10_big_fil_rev_8_21_14_0_10_55_24]|nr:MAG: threonine dehydratase [Candidatus Peregrinibacteria bacterium CG10_big_fil_rev_8_21_14_0_10_55_24]
MPQLDAPPSLEEIRETRAKFPPDLVRVTPLTLHPRLSETHGTDVYLKDERAQPVRSYKIRGAFAKMLALSEEQRSAGVVCASAGNHAQGVAAACNYFRSQGRIFMPTTTPPQKIAATQRHGNGFVEIVLTGDTFDITAQEALQYVQEHSATFIHPFNDADVMRGQATVGLEIWDQMQSMRKQLSTVVVPVGGGGLVAGTSHMLEMDDDLEIVGVEPDGAASMAASIAAGRPVRLEEMDTFADGAAASPGDLTYARVEQAIQTGRLRLMSVSKNLLCATMADLLQLDGELTEPAGALSIAALPHITATSKRGPIVCVVSGNNFDMHRMPKVLEHAALHRRQKAYLNVYLPDRPTALLELLEAVRSKLAGINITYMHFDEDQDNGNSPLSIGIASKTGRREDIEDFLALLGQQTDDQGENRYSYTEVRSKPST